MGFFNKRINGSVRIKSDCAPHVRVIYWPDQCFLTAGLGTNASFPQFSPIPLGFAAPPEEEYGTAHGASLEC